MSVANEVEIQFDFAKNIQFDQDSEKSKHMLILVFPPTIVHLQIQNRRQFMSSLKNPNECADEDFNCQITVMFPKRLYNKGASFKPMNNYTDNRRFVGRQLFHSLWAIVCKRNASLFLIHAVNDDAQILVRSLLEGLLSFLDMFLSVLPFLSHPKTVVPYTTQITSLLSAGRSNTELQNHPRRG